MSTTAGKQTNKHSKNTWNGKFYLNHLFELFEQNAARGNTGCETHQWWRWDRKNQHLFFKLARHEGRWMGNSVTVPAV